MGRYRLPETAPPNVVDPVSLFPSEDSTKVSVVTPQWIVTTLSVQVQVDTFPFVAVPLPSAFRVTTAVWSRYFYCHVPAALLHPFPSCFIPVALLLGCLSWRSSPPEADFVRLADRPAGAASLSQCGRIGGKQSGHRAYSDGAYCD
jgi:hypothetical protein